MLEKRENKHFLSSRADAIKQGVCGLEWVCS